MNSNRLMNTMEFHSDHSVSGPVLSCLSIITFIVFVTALPFHGSHPHGDISLRSLQHKWHTSIFFFFVRQKAIACSLQDDFPSWLMKNGSFRMSLYQDVTGTAELSRTRRQLMLVLCPEQLVLSTSPLYLLAILHYLNACC